MMRRALPIVWIVDGDLGLVCWLGQIFTEASCRALPALSCQEGVVLMNALGIEPDVIVLNPNLRGVVGMLQRCARANRNLKIITIGAPLDAVTASIHPHVTLELPVPERAYSRPEWVERVQRILREVQVTSEPLHAR